MRVLWPSLFVAMVFLLKRRYGRWWWILPRPKIRETQRCSSITCRTYYHTRFVDSLPLSLSLSLSLYLSRAVSSLLGIARERNCFRFALSRLFLLRRARRKRERRFFFFFRNFRDLFFLLFGDRVVANAY